jgi:hypothetical protein
MQAAVAATTTTTSASYAATHAREYARRAHRQKMRRPRKREKREIGRRRRLSHSLLPNESARKPTHGHGRTDGRTDRAAYLSLSLFSISSSGS